MKTSLPSLIPTKIQPTFQIFWLFKEQLNIPSTYEDLAWHVTKRIPTGYNRVYIVTDTYRPVSFKLQERDGRGRSNHIIINSVKSRTPCDFKEFLPNGENKSRLITLTFEYFVIKKAKVLNNLRATKLVLLEERKNNCNNIRKNVYQ